jgi:hypothetical protein
MSACTTTASASTQAPLPACGTPDPERNPYLLHPLSPGVTAIYNEFRNGFVTYDETRKRAFSQLGKNTERWSKFVDISLVDNEMVRITVTYLDPVLVQYIVLNHMLTPNVNEISGDLNAFTSKITTVMNELSGRNEMLFVVTITSQTYDKQALRDQILTVEIPVKRMALVNGSDLPAYPTHDDHILNKTINITHGPVGGIIGYPISVLLDENCAWVIDQYTNTLTLDVPSVTLGGEQSGPQYWNIPYQALIKTSFSSSSPTYDSNLDVSRIHRYTEPPKPNWTPNTDVDITNWKDYWEEMGGYIWNLIIMDDYH